MRKLLLTLALFSVICLNTKADVAISIQTEDIEFDQLSQKAYKELNDGDLYWKDYPDSTLYCQGVFKVTMSYDFKPKSGDELVWVQTPRCSVRGFFPVPRPVY